MRFAVLIWSYLVLSHAPCGVSKSQIAVGLRSPARNTDVIQAAGRGIRRTVKGNNLRPGIHGERNRPSIKGRVGMIRRQKWVKLNLVAPCKLDFCWRARNGRAIVVSVESVDIRVLVDPLARNARSRYLCTLGRRNLGGEPFKIGAGAIGADLGLNGEGCFVEVRLGKCTL